MSNGNSSELPPPHGAPSGPGRGRRARWPAVVVATLSVGMLLLIVAGVGLAWFGLREFSRQARSALAGNPVIEEHIGEIEALDIDFSATGEAPGEDTFVFEVRGSRGRGSVLLDLRTLDAEQEDLVGGSLRLEDGRVFPLVPEPDPPAEAEAPDAAPGERPLGRRRRRLLRYGDRG